ncbi:hypothetical protein MAR_009064 [Mya arenaria]|uniref:Phospholipase A2-like domain-containing protein n=1 Tax=Mya arenaria TaxID=6604 RepID=A0ABY7E1X5_MYAAR|nr:hypothetical protein MAR_009064 [Mya arenaria]
MKRGKCVECGSTKTQFVKGAAAPHKGSHSGSGVMNNLINKLPFEMHLPDHNFTGPGTNLNNRLNKDMTPKPRSVPINRVDNAAYHHDVCYAKNKDTEKTKTFLLTVIDVFSKYGWMIPLKDKTGKSVAERGLKRYSALRKAKLVDLLAQSTEHTSSLMDESIPDMGVATLQPINVEHRAKHVNDNVIDHVPNAKRRALCATPQRGLARDEPLGGPLKNKLKSDRIVIGSPKRSSVWRYIQSSINHCEVTLIFHFPTSIESKKAIISMKNEDDMCFTWCVLQALNPVDKNSERIDKSLKVHKDLLNMNGIEYPVTIKAIDRFERQNATISFNVFGYENKDVYPLRISKYEHNTCVNLLLIDDGEKQHYCLIKSMSRLLSSEWSKHKEYCDSNDAVKIEMLEEGSTLNLKHFFKSMRVPFIVYADFVKLHTKVGYGPTQPLTSLTQNSMKSIHLAGSATISSALMMSKILSFTRSKLKMRMYLRSLLTAWNKALKTSTQNVDYAGYVKDNWVRIGLEITAIFSGRYRGAVHNDCNLKYRKPKFTPVVFHNLSGQIRGNINCIPNNEEKYISFTKQYVIDSFTNKNGEEKEVKHELRFIDSFKFMASSLDKLVVVITFRTKTMYTYKRSGKSLNVKQLRDYHNLYLTSDVLLLADVFETFRDVCLTNYNLDPAWYYTAPGLAWDAALKLTEVELELISDPDMLLMIE